MSAPFTSTHDSATISTAEYFLASDSTTAVYQTTACIRRGWIDFSAMTAAETYDVTAYEKVNGSSAKVAWSARLVGVQAELFEITPQAVAEGWEISVTKVAGTDRSIGWQLDLDVGDANDTVLQGRLTSTRAGYLDNLSAGAVAQSSDISTLLSRLSSARAGYLDNLSAGAVALASSLSSAAGDITTILSRVTAAVATASALATAKTVIDAIDAKTTNLPSDPADQSLVIAATNAIAALIGTPSADLAADIAAIFARLGAPAGASVSADVAGVQTKLGSPAGASVSADIAAVKTQVNTIDGHTPALVGGNVPTKVMAYDTATAPDKMVWEAKPVDVGTVAGSYGELVARPDGAVVSDGANTALTFKTSLVSSDANAWKDAFLSFLDGDLAGQVHKITASAATGFVTFTTAFTDVPADGDRFILINK